MKNYFSLSRLKLSEIFEDTYTFIKDKYKQSDNVFSEASPFGQLLSVINRLFGMNLFYIEDSITELNITTANRPSSIYGLAALSGHLATRAFSSTGLLNVKYNGKPLPTGDKIIIPNYSKIKCKNNNLSYICFFSGEELIINTNEYNNHTFKIFQGELKNQKFTGTGLGLQTYEVNTVEGEWIDEFFVNVYVNGRKYDKVDSLYDMAFQQEACIVRTGITSGIDIIFGNGNFGTVPGLGSEIYIEYLVTEGGFGNLEKTNNIYFDWQDGGYDNFGNSVDLNQYVNIGMQTSISLGSFPESTNLTKELAPMMSRSLVFGQTSNYETFFKKMQLFSSIKIYTEFNMLDPYIDNLIYIFLIPDLKKRITNNASYFNMNLDFFKLTDFEKFNLYKLIEESGSKLFGTVPYFVDPIFEKFGMNIYVKAYSNFNQKELREKIINIVSEYLLSFSRTDYIPKSDIISLIEGVVGIDAVSIDFISEQVETLLKYLLMQGFAGVISLMEAPYNLEFSALEQLKLEYFFSDNPARYNIFDEFKMEDREDENSAWNSSLWDEDIYETLTTNNLTIKSLLNKKDCDLGAIYDFILSIEPIKTFINSKFDTFGNILLTKNILPIFRGGYEDRFGNFITDNVIDSNKLAPLNVYFETIHNSSNQNYINKNKII